MRIMSDFLPFNIFCTLPTARILYEVFNCVQCYQKTIRKQKTQKYVRTLPEAKENDGFDRAEL
jgi:hypothetical protein